MYSNSLSPLGYFFSIAVSFYRGTQLLFWYECAAQRGKNRDLENRLPPNLRSYITDFFVQFEALGTEIWSNFRLKNWFFHGFEALKCKFSKNLRYHANVGPWGTEKFWDGGLRERPGGREKGVFLKGGTYPFPIFRWVPPGFLSGSCLVSWLNCFVQIPYFRPTICTVIHWISNLFYLFVFSDVCYKW